MVTSKVDNHSKQLVVSKITKLLAETRNILPEGLHDPYWLPCTLIFVAMPGLKPFIASYFNFDREEIEINWFNEAVKPSLSYGEQFMVSLAFHLFNDNNPLPDDGLTGLRLIDSLTYQVALTAIHQAHGRGQE